MRPNGGLRGWRKSNQLAASEKALGPPRRRVPVIIGGKTGGLKDADIRCCKIDQEEMTAGGGSGLFDQQIFSCWGE